MGSRGRKGNVGNLYDDDLFSLGAGGTPRKKEPLAARMRPRTFSEFAGQDHIVGPGKLLRRAIEADQLTSIILWGPPGSGKTTIANIVAKETHADFVTLNAVLDGVKELRDVIEAAQQKPRNSRTILFVDEIHRWNKAQQDGLLPHVESGTITLIGATTENPFFSLVTPLTSRSRIFRLEPLKDDHVRQVIVNALNDKERGFGDGYNGAPVRITDDALKHLVEVSGGDARSALNALEMAVQTTPKDDEGNIVITVDVAAESIQRRAIRYDRDQDEHYNTVSAFIKSLRGSDPDAALYWMAKMLTAGEDPRVLFRRMIILACEDVGLADPQAVVVVNAAADAFERVGLPEGHYLLSHACLYLATAPKSNTASALFKALEYIEKNGSEPVPAHLRDSTANAMIARHEGEESQSSKYKYPHDYPGAWVEQQYLPEGMASPHWYSAKQIGYEQSVYERMSTHGSDVAEDGAVEEQDDMKPATPKGSSPIAAKPMARPAPKPSQKGKK
ncbi:MAG: replication-associated recombination protein A [Anaerolineae bacterium]|nr:replication-associated recombination protein A [Anaerolineae bacterium]